MKKLLVSSVASIGLAALPIIGVFAANPDPVVDNISISIDQNCTFTRTAGSGVYNKEIAANEVAEIQSTVTFTAICNNATGFDVTATPTPLSGPGEAINYSGTTPTAGSGTWTATRTVAGGNIPANDGILMSTNGPTSAQGVSESVVYKVSSRNNQAKGNYQGTMTYALVQR